MMTAEQAKIKTRARIKVIAEEFILNNVGVPLQDAIDKGRFHAIVDFKGIPSSEKNWRRSSKTA